jgi:hypothetical protein
LLVLKATHTHTHTFLTRVCAPSVFARCVNAAVHPGGL